MIMLYGSLFQRQSFVKTKHRTRERGDNQNNDHRFYIQKLCLWIAFDTKSTSKLNEVYLKQNPKYVAFWRSPNIIQYEESLTN